MRLPMLACDADESKIVFPCYVQPKIDGVRGMIHDDGSLTGRSLKPFDNLHIRKVISGKKWAGIDGEIIVGTNDAAPDLCRATTSAINTIDGVAEFSIVSFDLINKKTINLPYKKRYDALRQWVHRYNFCNAFMINSLIANNMSQLLVAEDEWLNMGYEGLIIRAPEGMYKEGRSTVREGGLMRLKRFVDGEAIVIGMEEGEHNGNEAKIGLDGKTERSSHKANKTKNGMLGSLECRVLKTVKFRGAVVLKKDQIITVSPGKMNHKERKRQWELFNTKGVDALRECLYGKAIKFQFFPKGGKDKPRFATFQSVRLKVDMS